MRVMAVLFGAALATAAAAQTSVGNPPGNTLAPATGAVAPPAPPPVAPAGDMAKPTTQVADKSREMICKTTIETGSLIARHKRCLTRAQWQYVNDENERVARKIVEDNMGRPTSN